MNNKKNYKKGIRKTILDLLLRCGCIPYKSLPLLGLRYPKAWMQMKMNEMKREGLIDIQTSPTLGRYAVFNNYKLNINLLKDYVYQSQIDYYDSNYYEDLKNRKSDEQVTRLNRVLRAGEIEILLHLLSISSGISEAKDTYYISSKTIKSLTEYNDKLVKHDNGSTSLNVSRVLGLLKCKDSYYAIYNSGKSLFEWSRAGEVKMFIHLSKLASNIEKKTVKVNNAIFFTYNYLNIEKLLMFDPKYKKIAINNIEDAYKNIYCLPYDINGLYMLEIMQRQNWIRELRENILGEPDVDLNNLTVDCDYYDSEKNEYTFLFCIPDLGRIKKAVNFINAIENTGNCRAICFSYQKELVMRLINKNAKIFTLDIEDYIKELGLEVFENV